MVVFGTRPEAIKLAPLIRLLKADPLFHVVVCVTGQHRQMLDQELKFFDILPDIDLNLMRPDQSLADFSALALSRLSQVYGEVSPDLVIVQGDTTTSFIGALVAYYHKIVVAHVEAGLRTQNIYSPFPEEVNRRLISPIANLNFTPTVASAKTLYNEAVSQECVFVTGNTVIDALHMGLDILDKNLIINQECERWFSELTRTHLNSNNDPKIILITGHRRESFGKGFENICQSIRVLAGKFAQHLFIYPVHLNPHVQAPVKKLLSDISNVLLLSPLDYSKMLYLMRRSYLILTDSGGIQEEAPSLRVPVLVMRSTTERYEGIELGVSKLVGQDTTKIVSQASKLLTNEEAYRQMQSDENPYGDGLASQRIVDVLRRYVTG